MAWEGATYISRTALKDVSDWGVCQWHGKEPHTFLVRFFLEAECQIGSVNDMGGTAYLSFLFLWLCNASQSTSREVSMAWKGNIPAAVVESDFPAGITFKAKCRVSGLATYFEFSG